MNLLLIYNLHIYYTYNYLVKLSIVLISPYSIFLNIKANKSPIFNDYASLCVETSLSG